MSSVERARLVTGNEAELVETLDDMSAAALHGASLARQMLLYSGKRRFTRQPFDSVHVEGDPTQLRQVILNLITNAAEAIGQRDGTVKVSVAREDDNVVVSMGVGTTFSVTLPQTTLRPIVPAPSPVVVPPLLTGTLLLVLQQLLAERRSTPPAAQDG